MSYGNDLTIIGNLVDAPELRFTAQGIAVANLRIAWNPPKRDGQPERETTFLRGTAWRDLAENLAQLQRGDRVILTGRIESRTFETREGEKRTVTELLIEDAGLSLKYRPKDAATTAASRTTGWNTTEEPPAADQPPF